MQKFVLKRFVYLVLCILCLVYAMVQTSYFDKNFSRINLNICSNYFAQNLSVTSRDITQTPSFEYKHSNVEFDETINDANMPILSADSSNKTNQKSSADDNKSISPKPNTESDNTTPQSEKKDFIKWIDFNATAEIMHKVIALVNHNTMYNADKCQVDFYEVLAYLALQNGNKFDDFKDYKTIKSMKLKLDQGTNPIDKFKQNKNFTYYTTGYKAILSGIIGTVESSKAKTKVLSNNINNTQNSDINNTISDLKKYSSFAKNSRNKNNENSINNSQNNNNESSTDNNTTQNNSNLSNNSNQNTPTDNQNNTRTKSENSKDSDPAESEKNYIGIVGFHPIAKGYWYNNYDDFGNSRTFGYKRRHLGNDMFGNIGTPIMAIEGGTIQELGWNRYGGWRIGIRSHDTNRYYYYAHLRKNKPYPPEFKKGDTVQSGQLIGYLGNTGYGKEGSTIKSAKPHLHLGLQIIFDPSQEKGSKEIWVDVYQIVRLLYNYRNTSQKPKV